MNHSILTKEENMGEGNLNSSQSGNTQVSFAQELWQNKFLLLTVVLAVGAAAYLGIGLVVLLGH